MDTAICYFSGTGNSLFVAKTLGEMLSDPVRIQPIGKPGTSENVRISEARVIIVFPVYFQTLPNIVKDFLKKARFDKESPDIYGIATSNDGPGHVLFSMKRILEKRGLRLKAGFCITMPGNSLILRDFTNPEEIRSRRLRECRPKIKEICAYILGRQSGRIDGTDQFKSHLQGIFTGLIARRIYRTPSKFRTTDRCTRCGTCLKVCPSENISIGEAGVKWGSRCEQCLACFHWCPQKAVEIGRFTEGKIRYHHPDISVGDMFRSVPSESGQDTPSHSNGAKAVQHLCKDSDTVFQLEFNRSSQHLFQFIRKIYIFHG